MAYCQGMLIEFTRFSWSVGETGPTSLGLIVKYTRKNEAFILLPSGKTCCVISPSDACFKVISSLPLEGWIYEKDSLGRPAV